MFGIGKKAQPKDAFEQPEIVLDERMQRIQQFNEALRRNGVHNAELDEASLDAIERSLKHPKANPSIISTVWR